MREHASVLADRVLGTVSKTAGYPDSFTGTTPEEWEEYVKTVGSPRNKRRMTALMAGMLGASGPAAVHAIQKSKYPFTRPLVPAVISGLTGAGLGALGSIPFRKMYERELEATTPSEWREGFETMKRRTGRDQPDPKTAGYLDTLNMLKVSSYHQNLVGFDDLEAFSKQRRQQLAYERAMEDYYVGQDAAAEQAMGPPVTYPSTEVIRGRNLRAPGALAGFGLGAGLGALGGGKGFRLGGGALGALLGSAVGGVVGKHIPLKDKRVEPTPEQFQEYAAYAKKYDDWIPSYRKQNPEPERPERITTEGLGGQEVSGTLGNYVAIPNLVGGQRIEGFTGTPTGQGYLSREALLQALGEIPLDRGDTDSLANIVKNSPHQYFTSTKAF